MSDFAQSSARFIEKFSQLAKRLANMGVTTHTADLKWGSFGCFTLMVMKEKEAIRFQYDGRDSFVTVEGSPVREYSYPNEWKELTVKGMDNRSDEVLTFIEEFLGKRFNF